MKVRLINGPVNGLTVDLLPGVDKLRLIAKILPFDEKPLRGNDPITAEAAGCRIPVLMADYDKHPTKPRCFRFRRQWAEYLEWGIL